MNSHSCSGRGGKSGSGRSTTEEAFTGQGTARPVAYGGMPTNYALVPSPGATHRTAVGTHPPFAPQPFPPQHLPPPPPPAAAGAPPGNSNTASVRTDFKGGQELWQQMLFQFLLYRAKNGATAIPPTPTGKSSQEDKMLHGWIQQQRRHARQYKDGERSFMTPERLSVLEHVKFPFGLRGDEFWKANYEKLRQYHGVTGHCRVPHAFASDPKLGEFVTDQRRQHRLRLEGKSSHMTDERKAKLDELGFEFSLRQRVGWDERLAELVQYKHVHGDCDVPQQYEQNKALGKWVSKQREQYRNREQGKKSSLTDERMSQLDDIGFTWIIHPSKKDKAAGSTAAVAEPIATAGSGVANTQAAVQAVAPVARKHLGQPQLQAEEQEQTVPPPACPQKRQKTAKTAPPILLPFDS